MDSNTFSNLKLVLYTELKDIDFLDVENYRF